MGRFLCGFALGVAVMTAIGLWLFPRPGDAPADRIPPQNLPVPAPRAP
jgi:hypothetical protein